MKPGRALFIIAVLAASAPLLADPDNSNPPSPAPAPVTATAAPAAGTAPLPPIMPLYPYVPAATCVAPKPTVAPTEESWYLPGFGPQCDFFAYRYNQWGLCPAFPPSPVTALSGDVPPINAYNTYITSDSVDGYQQGESLFTGNVQLDQGDRRLLSDRMIYNNVTGLAHAEGGVRYYSPSLIITGNAADYDTNKGSGLFAEATFLLPGRHGHGSAKALGSLDEDNSQMSEVYYTACPPGQEDWFLTAPDMSIDMATNTGIAHDVTIDFMGVPIFWSPYLNFPVTDDRKSGFLGPQLSFSTFDGFDISFPYYFNLADNYDFTLIPRSVTKRGVELGGEFRYLTASDDATAISRGEIDATYMPHDQIANRERSQLYLAHDTNYRQFWDFNTLYNWVSDDYFFQDLGNSLDSVATPVLGRHIRLGYDDEQDWTFVTQLQDFQVIDPDIQTDHYPYRRLPQAVMSWSNNEDVTGPQYSLYTELVRFQRDERIGTWRSDLKPAISYTLGEPWGYLTPTAAYRLTEYSLNEDLTGTSTSHLSRTLPIFSLDSGLYFDRVTTDYTQTLEPRFYYLRVPYRDQTQIPLFDTVRPAFTFTQLFTDNRFLGADRQADANQLSYALTSRLLDNDDGSQLIEADIGQIRYFSDRRVFQGTQTPPETTLFSDIVTEITLNPNDIWSIGYDQNWNPDTRKTDYGAISVGYHPAYHQVIDFSYRYRRSQLRRNTTKQAEIAFSWPITLQWSMVGSWDYDRTNHKTLEHFFGVEYDDCCWNLQLVHRRFVTPTGEGDSIFYIQFQLKGLATIGKHLEDFLQHGILGYSDVGYSQ